MSENHEFEIMKLLGKIGEDCAATKVAVENLAGPSGRVTILEANVRSANTRQWVHSSVVLPIVAAAHIAAKHLGF